MGVDGVITPIHTLNSFTINNLSEYW